MEVGFIPSVVACNFRLNGLLKLKCVDRGVRRYMKKWGELGYTQMHIHLIC